MNDTQRSMLLAAAVVSLMLINIVGDMSGWVIWAIIAVQLLIITVQISILRSGKVRS